MRRASLPTSLQQHPLVRKRTSAWLCGFFLLSTWSSSIAHAQITGAQVGGRPAVPANERFVDEVVASVALEGPERPPVFLLAGELSLYARYELAVQRGADGLRVRIDRAQERGFLEFALGERLLEFEAERAADPPPTNAELLRERTELAEPLGAAGGIDALVRAVGQHERDFSAFVRRRVTARNYLLTHSARTIEPTERELRDAYDDERYGPFRAQGVPFSVAREELREILLRRVTYQRAVRSYVRSIGLRARVWLWFSEADS